MKLEHEVFIDYLPYEWRSGTSDGLFLPIYPPRSMCVVLHFDNYSLRPEILVIEIDVSRCILVLDTSIFIHSDDKYFRTEGVVVKDYLQTGQDRKMSSLSLN